MSLVSRKVAEDRKSRSARRMLDEPIEGLLVVVATLGLGIGRQCSWKGIWSMVRWNYGTTIVPEILTRETSMGPLTSAP
jgi:hypothetical protein